MTHMNTHRFPFRGRFNFLGLPDEVSKYEDARAVLLPVPYDSTTSYRAGTREGPQAILAASRNVELFDHEFGYEPLSEGVHTLPELEPDMRGPEFTISAVAKVVEALVAEGKFPVMLGGEHSLTIAPIKVLSKTYGKELSVLQFDAHADLREEFENTPFSHASAMRRVAEMAPVTQIGIRNISHGEWDFVKKTGHQGIFWAKDLQSPSGKLVSKVVKNLKEKVYITIDLDVFDSSVMPSVGTPEPGGLTWYPVLSLLEEVARTRDIVGFDVVELCPIPGFIGPDFFAAKLVFKLLSMVFAQKGWFPRGQGAKR